ncbi:homocysteine S-methyltransferase [Sciscionella marina]|uniref:homocysteine S-methyltransferase n=1 Tax=Sciscionella marina TaxID=508770 RepID=UPI0003721412
MLAPVRNVLVTDGGLATELEARGHDLSDPLWSARVLLEQPEAIAEVHRAFFAAGAVIATTASYQASFEGFAARGLDAAQTGNLLRRSVELARAAAPSDGIRRYIAASVGPYGAVLADGSEYRGRYGLGIPELAAWHRPRLETLTEAGPDLLALETIPDLDEAAALVRLLPGLGVPAWLSFTIAGGRTRAGQPLAEAFALAAEVPEIVAVGVNCCAPAEIPEAVALATEVTGKTVVVYPNSGAGWNAETGAWTGDSRFSAVQARSWIEAGAGIVGGCCRIRAGDIAELASIVHKG